MLNGLIPLPWFMRKRIEPKLYFLKCVKCNYEENVGIGISDISDTYNVADETSPEPHRISVLPKVCPKCGGKLKKNKIPVIIQY